jgi:beta-phosphoglucomutase
MPETKAFAAIWDMDGTLVDTAELHFQAWVDVCRDYGRDFTRAEFAATFGQRNPEIIQQLFGDRFSARESEELGAKKEVYYREAARRLGVTLLPGARELLAGLHNAGFRQAIGSSGPRANLELIQELIGVQNLFAAIVGAEQTQRGKPDPQVFQLAAELLGVPPERSVVFEDAVAGVQAARAGGMKCVAVRFVGHHPEDRLREAGANLVVPTLEQVSVDMILNLFRTGNTEHRTEPRPW